MLDIYSAQSGTQHFFGQTLRKKVISHSPKKAKRRFLFSASEVKSGNMNHRFFFFCLDVRSRKEKSAFQSGEEMSTSPNKEITLLKKKPFSERLRKELINNS